MSNPEQKITSEERIMQLEADLEATKKKLKKIKTQKANVEETLNRSLLATKKRDEELGRLKKQLEAPSDEELSRQYLRDIKVSLENFRHLTEGIQRDIRDGFLINTDPINQAIMDAANELMTITMQTEAVIEISS